MWYKLSRKLVKSMLFFISTLNKIHVRIMKNFAQEKEDNKFVYNNNFETIDSYMNTLD